MRFAKYLAKILRRLPAIALLLTLSCTFQNLAVKQLDTVLSYQTSQRLSLYAQQKKTLEREVKTFLQAQKVHAPATKTWLQRIPPADAPALTQLWQQARELYLIVARDYTQLLVPYLIQLDGQQQEHFFKKIAEENAQLKKRTASRLPERLEFFIGALNSEQKKILANDSGPSRKRQRERLRRRLALQAALKDELARSFTTPQARSAELRKTLPALFESFQQEQANDTSVRDLLLRLLPTLTAAQLQTLTKKSEEAQQLLELFLSTAY